MGSYFKACKLLLFIPFYFSVVHTSSAQTNRAATIPFSEFYDEEYTFALHFISQYKAIFNNFAKAYPLIWPDSTAVFNSSEEQANFLLSIIFPELIRYSRFSDFFETTALEVAYTTYGKKAANYSIGFFQQRPSFIEDLETHTLNNPSLGKYKSINQFPDKATLQQKRKIRLKRLAYTTWQIYYLHTAIQYGLLRFSSKHFQNKEHLVTFFASYYNYGINATEKKIDTWSTRYAFPMGSKFTGKQYNYTHISLHYWKSTKQQTRK